MVSNVLKDYGALSFKDQAVQYVFPGCLTIEDEGTIII
jgi:hypothetical protein